MANNIETERIPQIVDEDEVTSAANGTMMTSEQHQTLARSKPTVSTTVTAPNTEDGTPTEVLSTGLRRRTAARFLVEEGLEVLEEQELSQTVSFESPSTVHTLAEGSEPSGLFATISEEEPPETPKAATSREVKSTLLNQPEVTPAERPATVDNNHDFGLGGSTSSEPDRYFGSIPFYFDKSYGPESLNAAASQKETSTSNPDQPRAMPAADGDADEKICRICFGGPDDEAIVTLLTLGIFTFAVFIAGFIMKLLLFWWIGSVIELEVDLGETGTGVPSEVVIDSELDDDLFLLFTGLGLGSGAGSASSNSANTTISLSLWAIDLGHFISGLVLVGLVGCLSLILTIFSGPVGPFPRFGVFRSGGGGGGDRFGAIVFGILLVIGIVKAVWGIYILVRSYSRRSLEIVEHAILEVDE
ncbi:hypothetical protein HK102_014052 [Quaeritorhiza haematococci]|nr:hypothetical protein HK102_014052 [Quaeritorhiza haematococci]